MSKLIKLEIEDVPSLPRHAKLRFDHARKKWIINAPERVFELDDIAGEVMQLINGKDTLKQIIDKLLVKYEDAPREQVTDDVIVIHIASMPRTQEMKMDFYKALPAALESAVGLKPDNVFISIVSNKAEDWSFGKGRAQLLETD